MATQLFLLNAVPDTHLGTDDTGPGGGSAAAGSTPKALGTARGSGVVASDNVATVTGGTAGVQVTTGGVRLEWISPPLAADVTISGTITFNFWASESNMSANVAIAAEIAILRSNALTYRNSNNRVGIAGAAHTTELAVTTRAANNYTLASGGYLGQTANRGDRLAIRVYGDDLGVMATGFTFNLGYNGTSAAADGDSYVSFTENFSFESAPAGSVLYLTNAQSGMTAAPALISDFTGSDENPLSEGGNWANLNTSGNPLKRISNAVSGAAVANCFSYWTPSNFGPDLDAYVTLSTYSGTPGIVVRIQGEGGAGTWDGYQVGASGANAFFIVVTNGVETSLASFATGATWANGDKLGVRVEGSTIQAWKQLSGSSTWNLVGSVVDSTYASAGKIGLRVADTTARLDDFYAATDSSLFTQKAWTSRGSGVVSYLSDTDTGWTAPLLTNEWFTPQLNAFTLTGMAQANIRALESNASANASLRCEIARVANDGTSPTVWASWCCAPTGTDNGELTTSEVARTLNLSGDDLAVSDGQRLRIRLYNEDISSAAMANAFNVQRFYNGTSAAASGDSYITLAQTVTEYTPPSAGSLLLPNRNQVIIRR